MTTDPPVAFAGWRGTVGVIRPSLRPGPLEELIRLLPEGVGVIPLFLGIREGTEAELRAALGPCEEKVAELAGAGVDLIHPEGTPMFMVHGFEGEERIVKAWEQRYGVPVVTAPQTQLEAMRALDMRSFVGVTYFSGEVNEIFRRYFEDAGFHVLDMEGMDVPFADVGRLSSYEIYAHAKRAYLRHPEAEGIYLLGSGWRVLNVPGLLEPDLGVPVVHAVAARVWALQKRLHLRQPVVGYGRLLELFP